jgi:DNA-binding transcriptional MerR regulator
LTLHRREILHETTLSGGGVDFYAQKKVVLRTRKRPSRQWVYGDDTIQRIQLAQELVKLGISLDDAAAALNGATLDEIRGAISTQPGVRAAELVRAIITRAGTVPKTEGPAGSHT